MQFKGELKDYILTLNNGCILNISTNINNLSIEELNLLKMAKNGLKIEIKQWREQRSLNANAYAWVIMDKIAQKISSTKEEVYKEIIKKVGVFEILPIKNVAVESFTKRWQSKGLGWVCEIMGDSKIPNYTNVMAYYGTSTYNTEEMARFIDEVVYIAKENEITTETPEQLAEMKSLWSSYEIQNK